MLATQLANDWMHDKSFPLLYFEKGFGRYQRQKYVGWTRNSWKLLETGSPQELASAVRFLQIEYGNSVRPSRKTISSVVPIDDRVVYLSEFLDAQNDLHKDHDKCVHLIVCLADKLFLRHEEKIASCMHRDKEPSEQLGPIIVSLCKICNCVHEEIPTHSNHNMYWRQDKDVVDIYDLPQSTTGPPPAFTDRYCYETSTILQIKILAFAELMVRLETDCRNGL